MGLERLRADSCYSRLEFQLFLDHIVSANERFKSTPLPRVYATHYFRCYKLTNKYTSIPYAKIYCLVVLWDDTDMELSIRGGENLFKSQRTWSKFEGY